MVFYLFAFKWVFFSSYNYSASLVALLVHRRMKKFTPVSNQICTFLLNGGLNHMFLCHDKDQCLGHTFRREGSSRTIRQFQYQQKKLWQHRKDPSHGASLLNNSERFACKMMSRSCLLMVGTCWRRRGPVKATSSEQ